MTLRTLTTIALAAGLLTAGAAFAQQQPAAPAAPPNLDAVPDKMPFATPYGAPITMERAQAAIQAAVADRAPIHAARVANIAAHVAS